MCRFFTACKSSRSYTKIHILYTPPIVYHMSSGHINTTSVTLLIKMHTCILALFSLCLTTNISTTEEKRTAKPTHRAVPVPSRSGTWDGLQYLHIDFRFSLKCFHNEWLVVLRQVSSTKRLRCISCKTLGIT